ncbi:MAG: sigma-70 family RNA polymerase sigma factor, partial [Gemmatimonadetes bacterium]|nr:sigma-70 family RNA polymerase sigma factor [Gemmatimonadota bacterium]
MLRVAHDDTEAFEALIDLYWAPLIKYAMHLLGSADSAEDVVQETFIRVWRRRTGWSPRGSAEGYLYRVARNLALDEIKRTRIRTSWARAAGLGVHADREDPLPSAELRAEVEAAIG